MSCSPMEVMAGRWINVVDHIREPQRDFRTAYMVWIKAALSGVLGFCFNLEVFSIQRCC